MAIAPTPERLTNHAALIWAIADLFRGDYKPSEYGRVILPLVVLRRLDCVLEPSKAKVLDRLLALRGRLENVGPVLQAIKRPGDGGGRLAIVFNGSPLFTGGAGSGESEIRRWIIENDWLEGVVALPDQLFYNTGISTYFWIMTNRKKAERRGNVQIVDARELFTKMRKSLGNKRKEIGARPGRRSHPPLRRVRGERAGEDPPQ